MQLGLEEDKPLRDVSVESLQPLVSQFKGGNITNFYHNWEKLTSDANIISIIKYGLVLKFNDEPPSTMPYTIDFNVEEAHPIEQ